VDRQCNSSHLLKQVAGLAGSLTAGQFAKADNSGENVPVLVFLCDFVGGYFQRNVMNLKKATLNQLRRIGTALQMAWQHSVCALANFRRRLFRKRLADYPVIVLDHDLSERAPDLPWWYGYIPGFRPPLSLEELGDALRRIAGDPDAQGVVLLMKGAALSLAQAQSLANLFARFRQWDAQTRKPEVPAKQVIVHLEQVSAPGYLAACAADRIVMAPLSTWEVLGLRATPTFLKDSLARLGIQFDVVKIAPWKTAMDTLSRSSMSDEQREQFNWLLDSWYEDMVNAISQGRQLEPEQVKQWIDRSPLTAMQAKEAGLIDAIAYEDELPYLLGQPEKPVRLQPYEKVHRLLMRYPQRRPARAVGVLSLMGAIATGRSRSFPIPLPIFGDHLMGSATVQQQIRAALQNDSLAAVVVHVDSRGGSALASDLLWRELKSLDQEKPVIVYMGDVAASGGYYIALPGRKIVAQSATLTGSIGVIISKVITRDALTKLGAHREIVQRGENSGLYHDDSDWTERQRHKIEDDIHYVYHEFKRRVAESRRLSEESLDGLCQGRVWTGRQAQAHGLIDALGDFQVAFDLACQAADLPVDGSVRAVSISPAKEYLLAPATATKQALWGLLLRQEFRQVAPLALEGDWGELLGHEHLWLLADGLPKV
jgi:protease-4